MKLYRCWYIGTVLGKYKSFNQFAKAMYEKYGYSYATVKKYSSVSGNERDVKLVKDNQLLEIKDYRY